MELATQNSVRNRTDSWHFLPARALLGIKNKILTVDLPHKLRAKFDSLFELLFGLAL
jgi:hypothetical protein